MNRKNSKKDIADISRTNEKIKHKGIESQNCLLFYINMNYFSTFYKSPRI
jgi:hypothetical protein